MNTQRIDGPGVSVVVELPSEYQGVMHEPSRISRITDETIKTLRLLFKNTAREYQTKQTVDCDGVKPENQ